MFTTYVLFSQRYQKIYIGYSADVEDRLVSHNERATKGYTLKYRPWEIVHTETFNTKKEALKRERELKTARGRKFIWEDVIAQR